MTFTDIGRLVAKAAIALGLLRIFTGLGLAISDLDPIQMQRYIGKRTTGQAIDQGMYSLLVGIAFGILTDISRSVSNSK